MNKLINKKGKWTIKKVITTNYNDEDNNDDNNYYYHSNDNINDMTMWLWWL